MKRLFIAFSGVLIAAVGFYVFCPKPEINTFTTYSKVLIANDGKLLRITLAEDDRYRVYEPLSNISPDFVSATILYEDKNYYHHLGVDFPALLRAFWATYVYGERRIGASTIVMQVARLRWSIRSNTVGGKIQQILRAFQLTRHFSRKEILEAYLNMAPYGRNIEGIAAASLIYFNKKPSELSFPEALTLAVIPQNPNKRNPTTANGYQSLLFARDNLLQRWLELYPDDIAKKGYFDLPLNVRKPEKLPFLAPHFTNHVLNKHPRWEYGYINTTLDTHKQRVLESIIDNYTSLKAKLGIHNAAALLVRHDTMEVQAMVGSADFFNTQLKGQVNGVLAKRSPGSTLKPFVYALAIDDGLIHPLSLMKDAQTRFGGFTPENYDKRFMGPISVKNALIESRNVPAVALQNQLKKISFYQFLHNAGISGLKEESHYGLALALGGGEVSMLELVSLYSALANKGKLRRIYSVKSDLKDDVKNTRVINEEKSILSAEASFLILDMLKDNPEPGGINIHSESLYKNEVAWKTGTSWAFRDAWAVGISGPYVLAVWVGNFDGTGNSAFVGRRAAGPLLFSIFNAILPESRWRVEDLTSIDSLNLKKLEMCEKTGDLMSQYCPNAVNSWFIPGVSPIKVSNIYRAIPIDPSTGLRACMHKVGKTQMEVFEFWPSDFLHVFSKAGISLKTPPQYSTDCTLEQKSSSGKIPVITSPQSTIEYIVQGGETTQHSIPFAATVDPDVRKVYWFLDGKYEGSSKAGEPFMWSAVSGQYQVRVVDDSGRASSRMISVLQAY